MAVIIKEVQGSRTLRRFIHLPAEIHAGHSAWVPPIYVDERNYFNPQKNKAFSYCDTLLLLAHRDGKVVGRIMGIINNRHNSYRQEKTARFGYLEAREDEKGQVTVHREYEDRNMGEGAKREIAEERDARGGAHIPEMPRRRGRPKGSKNKPAA